MSRSGLICLTLLACLLEFSGCGSNPPPAAVSQPAQVPAQPEVTPAQPDTSPPVAVEPEPEREMPRSIPSISLNGPSTSETAKDNPSASPSGPANLGSQSRKEILQAMDPLQIMLGKWRGTTQKPIGDFKGLDESEWVWDFKTDRDHPSMVMKSDASPYFREARLSYTPGDTTFHLHTQDAEGKTREFTGKFAEAAEKFQGDDDRTHIKYKLELDQTDGESPRDTWQVVFNQQENNRFLMEIGRKQGSRFMRFDTVATQRQGTSFAKTDDDYGEKTCIISGGLGTMQVSFKGKSYWVCCTGCKAAFEDDPATWIAEFEAKQKK